MGRGRALSRAEGGHSPKVGIHRESDDESERWSSRDGSRAAKLRRESATEHLVMSGDGLLLDLPMSGWLQQSWLRSWVHIFCCCGLAEEIAHLEEGVQRTTPPPLAAGTRCFLFISTFTSGLKARSVFSFEVFSRSSYST